MSKTILAVLAALMLSSGIAHADADDNDFLRALHQQNIKDTHNWTVATASYSVNEEYPSLSESQDRTFVLLTQKNYCPTA